MAVTFGAALVSTTSEMNVRIVGNLVILVIVESRRWKL